MLANILLNFPDSKTEAQMKEELSLILKYGGEYGLVNVQFLGMKADEEAKKGKGRGR